MTRTSAYMVMLIGITMIFFTACEESSFEPEQFGSIEGIVRNAETNDPVAGAAVSTNPPTSVIVTGNDGRFTLRDIEVGTYSISIKKTGYLNANVSVSVREGQATEANIFLEPRDENASAPAKPTAPIPGHQSTDNPVPVTLSWSLEEEGSDSVTFDVYFFESSQASEKKIASGISDTSITVEDLRYGTSYFWQVATIASDGRETYGPTWSFQTRAFPDHRIVFTSGRDGNYEIYSTHPDSLAREVIRLTNNLFRDTAPRFDHQRERIAFVSDRDGQQQIYIMNRDGSDHRRVTNIPVAGYHNYGIGIAWAPNGGHLIYANYERLYRINSDGSNQQLIATAPAGRHFREVEYNHNGSRIVALTIGSSIHDSEVYVMNADGSDMTLIYGNRTGIIESPSFSIDGQRVMFTYDTSNHQDPAGRQLSASIFIVGIDGSDTTTVSQHRPSGTNDTRPRFSPDGASIVFENQPNDASRLREIYIMNADGTNRFRVTENGEMPDWR
jgi:TolB protein